MAPARSTGAARQQAGLCSLGRSVQAALADDIRERFNELRLRLAAGGASVMELAKASKGNGAFRCIIHDDWMDEAGSRFVHVAKSFQRPIPFPDKDAFIALVGVCGNHRNKDVASGDVLLDHRPPRIAGLEASLVKPNIQSRADEAAPQPLDRVTILAGIADENGGRLACCGDCGSAGRRFRGLVRKGIPFLRKLVHELDGIPYTKRPGLRTEVLQEIVQEDVTRYGSVGHEFARVVTAVEAITASKANKEPRQPVGMSVTDEEQALRAHFVEEIC